MKDLVYACTTSIDTERKKRRSFVREDEVHLAKGDINNNNINIQPNELIDYKKTALQKVLSEIQTLLHNKKLNQVIRPSDLSGQFDDINALANSGAYDKAIEKAQELLEYTSLTLSPKKDIRVKQSPVETPPTDEELKNGTKKLEYGEFDENESRRKGIEKTLAKVQERLDFATHNPGTLTPEEVSFFEQNIALVKQSLEQDNYTKAFEQSDTLAHEAALLVPLETDYDFQKNVFHKKVRKQLNIRDNTFQTNSHGGEKSEPSAVDGNIVRKTQPGTPKNVKREPILAVTEPLIPVEPILPETVKIPLEPSSETSIPSSEKEDLFEDFDDITINPEPIPENNPPLSRTVESKPSPRQQPAEISNTDIHYAGDNDVEASFFEQGEKIDAEQQALAQEKRGFFSRVFDKLRPSQETPEDKLVRILQKEKWLQNIPKMSHSDVLVSLKKFGVDLTGGAVDEQLKHVGPLLRSNTETGEVFKALWDKYLETQVHEKKKWEEAIPNMDIDHVYMNLEKFGINPDEDGRRDVKAKILALRSEPGKRGEVFRMLFDRYIEIQNNNIRFLQYADKNKVIQFLKMGYQLDATYYFEKNQTDKTREQRKQIDELRQENSTRGKVIDAAIKRLGKIG